MTFIAKTPEHLPRLIHGIEAEDWNACWNMQLGGTLVSIDFAGEVELGTPGLRALSLEDLRRGSFGEVFLAPRMLCLWQAAVIRSGGWVGEGAPPYPTQKASVEESKRVVRQADFELRMEEARRHMAPNAPTPIGCLYLAEDSATGRTMVSELKGHDAFLMQVQITNCLRLTRLDSQWLNGPIREDEIAGYWSSEPRDDHPQWEYLLDGVIACTDEEELERLRQWGWEAGVRASGTQGPIGTPRDR
jgi:hypothetical protein